MTDIVDKWQLKHKFASRPEGKPSTLQLDDGSRIAVIGGGPAGSFVSYFLLDMADMMGMDIHVDIYEPRDYTRPGPASCNHCGGIISSAADGIKAAMRIVGAE